jgi:PTH1 family peptidyl-tRNA hydrolase
MSLPVSLYVFLGNPGRQYENTRHNAAWMLLDELAPRTGGLDWQLKFKGAYAKLQPPGRQASYCTVSTVT